MKFMEYNNLQSNVVLPHHSMEISSYLQSFQAIKPEVIRTKTFFFKKKCVHN